MSLGTQKLPNVTIYRSHFSKQNIIRCLPARSDEWIEGAIGWVNLCFPLTNSPHLVLRRDPSRSMPSISSHRSAPPSRAFHRHKIHLEFYLASYCDPAR